MSESVCDLPPHTISLAPHLLARRRVQCVNFDSVKQGGIPRSFSRADRIQEQLIANTELNPETWSLIAKFAQDFRFSAFV
jgi:hypothetical protein